MRIVTISREFGSGGREPGKRLAGLDAKIRCCTERASEGRGMKELASAAEGFVLRRYGR